MRRLVKVDLAAAGPPEEWDDLIPQHDTDLLQWASAHEVSVSQCCAAALDQTSLATLAANLAVYIAVF